MLAIDDPEGDRKAEFYKECGGKDELTIVAIRGDDSHEEPSVEYGFLLGPPVRSKIDTKADNDKVYSYDIAKGEWTVKFDVLNRFRNETLQYTYNEDTKSIVLPVSQLLIPHVDVDLTSGTLIKFTRSATVELDRAKLQLQNFMIEVHSHNIIMSLL